MLTVIAILLLVLVVLQLALVLANDASRKSLGDIIRVGVGWPLVAVVSVAGAIVGFDAIFGLPDWWPSWW